VLVIIFLSFFPPEKFSLNPFYTSKLTYIHGRFKQILKLKTTKCHFYEAIIYLDKGLDVAEKFISKHWKDFLIKSSVLDIDSKTKLQEYSLKKFKTLPVYKFFKQSGPQHRPIFKVNVQINNSKIFSATGASKKIAEQNAAKKLIIDLKI